MFSLYQYFVSQYLLEKSELEKNKQLFYNVATLWEIFEHHAPNICKSLVRHAGITCCFKNCMCLVSLHMCRLVANAPPYAQTVHFEGVVWLLVMKSPLI